MTCWLSVLVQTPAHASLGPLLSYRSSQPLAPGTLVRVPLGPRETLGVVWSNEAPAPDSGFTADKIRDIASTLDGIAPLDSGWRQLVRFAAQYYQRSIGEVALACLPAQLRDLSTEQMQRRLRRLAAKPVPQPVPSAKDPTTQSSPLQLSEEQIHALAAVRSQSGPFLLFGATGSGKTEVYLQSVQELLARDSHSQALVMVPEINLTPQLEERFQQRFAAHYGAHAVVSMHSGMTPAQRLNSWLAAHSGQARIVLGTRMAIFASMPGLQLIVVDEEHDPSYKSTEGARYSARDLAVYRGKQASAKVILGSATPSLESWYLSRPADQGGRYQRLYMQQRIGAQTPTAGLPLVRRVDMNHQPRNAVFSIPLLEAIKARVARGEQCMVFLNRRGYAPVLHCADCGWKSECAHCSAFRVFHKIDRSLRCHHCGFTEAVPRSCPACGNPDIAPIGRGTEQLEEQLAELLSDVRRPSSETAEFPEGRVLRIARIDADSTRHKGALQTQLAAVHAGEVDVLVGTQMIAKGHDFRRITLVAAVNPDGALFSSDFRAPERLFGLLMQATGRAGRDATLGENSEVWIQTFQPAHPLYAALKVHDYPGFAEAQLQEREQAGMPPFSAQALLRAEARTQEAAQQFLNLARTAALQEMAQWPDWGPVMEQITVYPAVPMAMQRIANVERAQMLVESPSRAALQHFLQGWHGLLHATRPECKGLIRWAVDVDPLSI